MSSNDFADSTVEEADRRVERAKASLLSRVDALKHKLSGAKLKVDMRAQIAGHPLPAVGIAFALGVLAGLRHTRTAASRDGASHPVAGAMFAGLTAFGLRMVRELAIGQLSHIARQWWSEHDGASATEARASEMPAVEPFLEH